MGSQKVIVAGTGVSGIAAAKLLLALGGKVLLYDGNDKLSAKEIRAKFTKDAPVSVLLGELRRSDLADVELCIISPGIPLESKIVSMMDELKIPVWGEIQLAYHCAKGRVAAITGTNGKTTTTALTGQIVKDYLGQAFVVGNIGIPYTQIALETEDDSVTVAEISSFQLETIMNFHPQVGAILNITPDHLDRHRTMERYIEVKKCITVNQEPDDVLVLNYEDPVLREFGLKREKAKRPDGQEPEKEEAEKADLPNGQEPKKEEAEKTGLGNEDAKKADPEMTEEEKTEAREQIRTFKERYRLFQFGNYYRITSPLENRDFTAWEYADKEGKEAYLGVVYTDLHGNPAAQSVKFRGLRPEGMYSMWKNISENALRVFWRRHWRILRLYVLMTALQIAAALSLIHMHLRMQGCVLRTGQMQGMVLQ